MSDLKSISKNSFNSPEGNTLESIQTGCLQRIADSLERMEKPYQKLIDDYNHIKTVNDRLRDANQRLLNQIRTQKGWITRLKRKESEK